MGMRLSVISILMALGLFSLGVYQHHSSKARTPAPTTVRLDMGDKEAEIQEIVRKFILEADARHVKFGFSISDIQIVPDMDDSNNGDLRLAQPLAYCIPGSNQIKVNDLSWDSMNATAKEMVLFHEMGHCMLQRAHREDASPEGRKLSMMSSRKRWLKNQVYLDHRKEYLDELFNPKYRGDLHK